MKTLEYYSINGEHKTFDNYTINENGVVTNIKTGNVMSQHGKRYSRVTIRDNDGTQRKITVSRAIASTFLGNPPTNAYTVDHVDRDSRNDVLKNIRWLTKSGQTINQERPADYKSAFIIVKDGIEKTANEWAEFLKDELSPHGHSYTSGIIRHYARQQYYGFQYKVFEDLPEEEWRIVEESRNKQGVWYISSEGRVKYKTEHAENIIVSENLSLLGSYPSITFSNKHHCCHIIAFKTFFPEKYAVKKVNEYVLHREDNKFDFRPRMLYLGTHSQNQFDAHRNGSRDNAKTKRRSVASYLDGEFEKEHRSLTSAVDYLRQNGYQRASMSGIQVGLKDSGIRYDRTWKILNDNVC